jgi:hypothetical protein
LIHQFADRPVQLGQREEPPVAQPCQDPALHHLHADLDLGLVTRFVWTRGNDCGAVVRRHVGIGAVHRRLVETGLGDPGLEVVADNLPWHPTDGVQCVDMGADPVRQRLTCGGFGVDEARCAEHGDEDFGTMDLAGRRVDHLHGVPGEVDEQSLARDVHLAQCRLQPPGPLAIQIAEPRVAESVGRRRAVFLPQQRQRHVRPPQIAMHRGPVRDRALIGRHIRQRRE